MINKEEIIKGINCELNEKRLLEICQKKMEEHLYYDYNLFLATIYKALKREISFEYFTTWCVLICNCLNYVPGFDCRKKKFKILSIISDIFDGFSFEDEFKEKELYYLIARFKYQNFLLENKEKKAPLFLSDGVLRMLSFNRANWTADSCVYMAIYADYNTKTFSIRFVDDKDFGFMDNLNYSFVEEDEIDSFISKQFYNDKDQWIEDNSLNIY